MGLAVNRAYPPKRRFAFISKATERLFMTIASEERYPPM
jgi:hypothetical protein